MTSFLTTAEVAKLLRISEEWVRSHAAKRRRPYLPAVRIKGEKKTTYRFIQEDIEAWVKDLTK